MANYVGTTGPDTYNGTSSNDSIVGGAGNDTLNGAGGNDFVDGASGDDSLLGGDGNDTVAGDDGNDVLQGEAGDDLMFGEAGNDFLRGNLGNDALSGGAGQDTLNGGNGDDTLDGGVITDAINYSDLNVVSYAGMGGTGDTGPGVNVNLQTGVATDGLGGTDTLSNFMSVVGSDYGDTILGTADWSFEIFDGGLGDDTIDGGELSATSSNRVTYFTASGAVQVDLSTNSATGAAGNDTLLNINHVQGSKYGDLLVGSDSEFTETFMGRAGNDTIDGGGGLDIARYDFRSTRTSAPTRPSTASARSRRTRRCLSASTRCSTSKACAAPASTTR
ncbi:hypothetical protein HK414_05265 [Ramlibacter terrae]|uniref:Calcium-binding protein n=1 Tax=Ramlibacter terrae TaxID=2732511 RepID=A0ABX6P0S9_9BURK|nr:hypothetical protein HK414_05265 [Ramlibacter terrae]